MTVKNLCSYIHCVTGAERMELYANWLASQLYKLAIAISIYHYFIKGGMILMLALCS